VYVRPHEITVRDASFAGSRRGVVRRVIALGPRVGIELRGEDEAPVSAELGEDDARRVAPAVGQVVFFAPLRSHSFAPAS
jgi:ABC-type sulfate/molybdate transport systems ATPase subunit